MTTPPFAARHRAPPAFAALLVALVATSGCASAWAGEAVERPGGEDHLLDGARVPEPVGATTCAAYGLAVALTIARPELAADEAELADAMGGLAHGASLVEVVGFARSRGVAAALRCGDGTAVRTEVEAGRPVLVVVRSGGAAHVVTVAGVGPSGSVAVVDAGRCYLLDGPALDRRRRGQAYVVLLGRDEGARIAARSRSR